MDKKHNFSRSVASTHSQLRFIKNCSREG